MSPTVTAIPGGVEVDVVTRLRALSVRVCEQPGGDLSIIVVDRATGRPVVAELFQRP